MTLRDLDSAAFPCEQGTNPDGTWNQTFEPGMSLGDYFAAKAMQSLLHKFSLNSESHFRDIANASYKIAGKMLQARRSFIEHDEIQLPPQPPKYPYNAKLVSKGTETVIRVWRNKGISKEISWLEINTPVIVQQLGEDNNSVVIRLRDGKQNAPALSEWECLIFNIEQE